MYLESQMDAWAFLASRLDLAADSFRIHGSQYEVEQSSVMGIALQLVMSKFYFLLYLSLTKLQTIFFFFWFVFTKQTDLHLESMQCIMM